MSGFFEQIIQRPECVGFCLPGAFRPGFPIGKVIAEISLITQALKLRLWFKAFVMAFLRVKLAVQADMEVPPALRTRGFPGKILVNGNLLAA